MKRLLLAACSLALAAAPAFAGPVYLPVAINEVDGIYQHVTELWATNDDDVVQGFVIRYLTSVTDGTTREEGDEIGPYYLLPRESRRFTNLIPPGFRGMLELDGSATMQFSAELTSRLVQTGQKVAEASLPVLGSQQLGAAGDTLFVQGWERVAATYTTNFGLVNFGHAQANCSVAVRHKDGLLILQGATIVLPALSHVQFDDALGLLGLSNVVEGAHAEVTCDQMFWSYISAYDDRNGAVALVGPSVSVADSSLTEPTTGPPPPPPPPTGSVVFERLGQVIRYPQNCCGTSNYRVNMPFGGSRTFRKVTVDFDLYVPGFDTHNPSGFHCLFWLNNGQSWNNMFGYVNSRGTQGRTVFQVNATGYGWQETTQYGGISPGNTYHVHYEYDTIEQKVWYEITRNGARVVGREYGLDVDEFTTNNFFIELGYQYAPEGPEAYTPGWTFSNLRSVFYE